MNREQEIELAAGLAAIKAHPHRGQSYEVYKRTFTAGAQWADSHPKQQWISVNDRLPEQPQKKEE